MTEITDRWLTPGPHPNGIQAARDGLGVIDQADNHLYKLAYEDGSVLARLPTETDRSSGVTEGGGFVWVASTYTARIYKLNTDGTTVEHHDTPGAGIVDTGDPNHTVVTGAHGMEWLDDHNMWIAVPPARRVFLVDPGTMIVRRSIPTPGARPHGVFVANGDLWCADTAMRQIHRLDPITGTVRAEIDVPAPEVHGMTLHEGSIWLCCAETRRVCTIPLPG